MDSNTNDDRHTDLVLAINELYHDIEGENYSALHPEIFSGETKRWQRMLRTYITPKDHGITLLDIGSGTGFVGEQLQNILKSTDTLICADLSATMLAVALKNIQKKNPHIHVEGRKLLDEMLPFPDASIDVVTLNSVLHHIPNTNLCLKEITRVLKPGGLLFIGHEPNIRFIRHNFLRWQAMYISTMIPGRLIARLLRFVGVLQAPKTPVTDTVLERVNLALMSRGLIQTPLNRPQMAQLVDRHSPTAGGIHRNEGFDPWTIFENQSATMHLVCVETYNHLSKISGRYLWLKPYEKLLQCIASSSGATFFLVARKA